MSTESGAGPRDTHRMRASDGEREQVAQVLRAAMTEGRLTLEEGEERLAKVYAAAYRDELTPLVTDLPGGGWRALVDTPEVHAQMRRYAMGRIGFIGVIATVLVGLWLLSGAHFFWPLIPLVFLTFALLRALRWRRYGWGRGPWHGPHQHGRSQYAPPWARS
ncbi:MAG TPA: DUF1707 domain-containing protein [Micromonosporaceae bacterium]|jgi:hypothetical protein|nr:DUF1707 domain-containing protein [Micromonosporaceae bacterium]